MIKTINEYDFQQAFVDAGRKDSFSWEGMKALFEYLEGLGDDMGQPIELDVIALDCEFCEFDDLADFQANYGAEEYPDMESIRDATPVIEWGTERFIVGEL